MPQQLHKLVPVPDLQFLEHFDKAQNQPMSRKKRLGHILAYSWTSGSPWIPGRSGPYRPLLVVDEPYTLRVWALPRSTRAKPRHAPKACKVNSQK